MRSSPKIKPNGSRVWQKTGSLAKLRLILSVLLAAFFLMAGISHFTNDAAFAAIVPPLLPFPYAIVWITGVMEIVFAIGLLIPKYRAWAGLALAPFLLAVLPANIYMALEGIQFGETQATTPQLWFRVFLQFPLIALILWASGAWAALKMLTKNH